MNSSFDSIRLPRPVRDIRLEATAAPGASGGQPSPEALRASYEQGRIDGERALSEQLINQRNETQELLRGVTASLSQAVPQVIHDTEGMMVSLALEVAQKLVSDASITTPMIEAAVRGALAEVEGTAQFTVRLHPADLELLQKSGSTILTPADGPNEFRFLTSPEVTRGGCIVQTRFGTVDARRETKFDLLKRTLNT